MDSAIEKLFKRLHVERKAQDGTWTSAFYLSNLDTRPSQIYSGSSEHYVDGTFTLTPTLDACIGGLCYDLPLLSERLPTAKEVIDSNAKRKLSDQLHLDKCPPALASIALEAVSTQTVSGKARPVARQPPAKSQWALRQPADQIPQSSTYRAVSPLT